MMEGKGNVGGKGKRRHETKSCASYKWYLTVNAKKMLKNQFNS